MKTAVAVALAALWSIVLLIAAEVAPVYSSSSSSSSSSVSANGATTTLEAPPTFTTSSSTLVEENGSGVLIPVGIPLLVVAVVGLALGRRRHTAKPGAGPLAWTLVALLGAFNLLAMMSIGIFVLPVTFLLLIVCALSPSVPHASPPTGPSPVPS